MSNRLVLCMFLFLPLSTIAQPLPETVAAPVVHVGDRWTLQHTDNWAGKLGNKTTQEVVASANNEIRMESKNAATGVLAFRLRYNNEMNPLSRGTMRYSPHFPRYAFPLEPGKTWSQDITAENSSNGRAWNYQVKGKVEGWEKVTVPAGQFDALKVKITAFYQGRDAFGGGGGQSNETVWYAPAVNNFVKHEYQDTDWKGKTFDRSTWELEAYSVKQPSLPRPSSD
jgi:hypothetical protein